NVRAVGGVGPVPDGQFVTLARAIVDDRQGVRHAPPPVCTAAVRGPCRAAPGDTTEHSGRFPVPPSASSSPTGAGTVGAAPGHGPGADGGGGAADRACPGVPAGAR